MPAPKVIAALVAWTKRTQNAGVLLAVTAWVWFALVSLWGLFAMHTKGHLGGGLVTNAMIGENCFRWDTLYPSWNFYTSDKPPQSAWMCSHPYGIYWLGGLMATLFGNRDFAVPLPAIVMSILTPPLLYLTLKDRWGTVAAAAASWGFACLPITMAFARFQSLEVLCMFGCVLFFLGHSRYQANGKPLYLLASLAGVVVACSGDWPGFIVIGVVLGWSLVRVHLLPVSFSPPLRVRLYTRWWALSASVAVLMFIIWIALFFYGDRIDCWLAQAALRKGNTELLSAALLRRRHWIDLSFTPLAILLGKIAAPLGLVRLLVIRRDEEVFAPAVLLAAVFQYCVFKQGADVHPFWPHYFGLYFALALGQLVATITTGVGWTVRRFRGRQVSPRLPDAIGVLGVVTVLLFVLPDGVRGLRYWRGMGGNYGFIPDMGGDMIYVIRNVLRPRLGADSHLMAHRSATWSGEQSWAATRTAEEVSDGPQKCTGRSCFWIARASALAGSEWSSITSGSHVRAYGDIWLIDSSEPTSPIDSYSLHEREPGLFEWWLIAQTEPMRSIDPKPDPFTTWVLRRHLGQTSDVALPPPSTLIETSIAYDVALDRSDGAAASRLRKSIEDQLDRTRSADFTRGLRIIGTRLVHGHVPTLEVWVEAQEPNLDDLRLAVTSEITSQATMSFIPIDETPQTVSVGSTIPASLWRPGFLYRFSTLIQHRPGVEKFSGAWQGGAAPGRLDGQPSTFLGTYP